MIPKLLQVILLSLISFTASNGPNDFIFQGFHGTNLSLDSAAQVTPTDLLMLTNSSSRQQKGHAFFPHPFQFKNSSKGNDSNTLSFSTAFVFAIVSDYLDFSAHGIAFVISPTKGLPGSGTTQYLGLFNNTNNGNFTNHVVAIEFDTLGNPDFGDINDNHVGIDINGLRSIKSAPAAYFSDKNGESRNINLKDGEPIQVWVDYNGSEKQLNVTISPIDTSKPSRPLLSLNIDLSPIILETMFVGLSSSTGVVPTSHYVLGWSFKLNGKAQELDLPLLPRLPRRGPKKKSKFLTIGLPFVLGGLLFILISAVVIVVRRKIKYAEILEDWELEYGPHRFKFKDLFKATKGFKEKELLGIGGFGRVYKGVLPKTKTEIAVKRVSHESRQGIKEFIAEIVSIGRLRHRNLVQLLGYCRRRGELLLVYDFMRNGSLDKFLFDQPKSLLDWSQRFRIIKGVASGILYLHEQWEMVVIHRDIKSSNVLLDDEFNARLGDFGLARLYDHGSNPQTTHLVGTLGYIAPEIARTSKATTSSDVFSYGAFILEVACGRRPLELRGVPAEKMILVDWVSECWKRGDIKEAYDPKLGSEDVVVEEVELVLKLGLICSHPEPVARPSIRQVMQILEGDSALPELLVDGATNSVLGIGNHKDAYHEFSFTSSVPESLLSGGRWP